MIAWKKRFLSRQQSEDAGSRLAERGIESSIVSRALSTEGFSYQSGFAAPAEGRHLMTCLAQTLGQLRDDVIATKPERDAPAWRPFDQAGSIEWHNDFSSHAQRPRFSLSFIEVEDPRGSPFGDWRIAKVADIVHVLSETEEGRQTMQLLRTKPMPFMFDRQVRWFPVLDALDGHQVLRFNGATLRAGCREQGLSPDVLDAIAAVESAADQVAIELAATTGALLVVDNWSTLHFRREQSVGLTSRREAVLMFVD